MSENKLCPHCGGQMFMATITRACVVEVTTDSNEPYKILKEGKDKFDIELLKCARCKESIEESDLVANVKCKECGRAVSPMDIDENGVCNVCTAIHQRSELANASKEDLIKMLLDAEKKANPVIAKVKKQIAKAEDISDNIEQQLDNAAEVTLEESEEDMTKKKTRRRTRKKKDDEELIDQSDNNVETIDSTENTVSVEEVKQEEVLVEETTVVNDIASQQDAPFPDMNLPENDLPENENIKVNSVETAQEEQPIGADFRMFDEGEEPF